MSQKLYNFVDTRLKPEISCDVAFADDYGPERLANSSGTFMAYNVVKPPANLTLNFICKVDIQCIKVFTKIGSLKSTHIEISAEELGRVAYGTCEEQEEDGVCFIKNNPRNEEFLMGSEKLNKSNFFRTLRPTKSLTVIIKRTNKCPPVIRKIEIWARLARDCTIHELELVEKLWNVESEQADVSKDKPSKETSTTEPKFTIPEEFLDEITFQLMSLPMTLPSGHHIDESTLEKCQKLDFDSNRPACDPFTGLAFTTQRKPLFNSGLKARIDKFLMSNADQSDVRNAPRTIGTRQDFVPRNSQGNPFSRLELTQEMSFEEKLKVAIDAIRQRNNSLTKDLSEKRCSDCETIENLYKISGCPHYICRRCLLGSKETRLTCKSCSTVFKRSEVQKHHNCVR